MEAPDLRILRMAANGCSDCGNLPRISLETGQFRFSLTIGTNVPEMKGDLSTMKRILLALLLMLPAITAVNVASDPFPPCLPCRPGDGGSGGTKGGGVMETTLFQR